VEIELKLLFYKWDSTGRTADSLEDEHFHINIY